MLRVGKVLRETEISDFQREPRPSGQQQILRFQVHVADAVVAQIAKSQRELLQELPANWLWQRVPLLYEIRQVAAVAVLHYDVCVPAVRWMVETLRTVTRYVLVAISAISTSLLGITLIFCRPVLEARFSYRVDNSQGRIETSGGFQ